MLQKYFSLLLVVAVLAACPGYSLAGSQGDPVPGQHPSEHPDEQEAKLQREQAKRLNKDRQEALKRDTENLLRLSTELKEYVDKSNENVLSLQVIKKAEQIEKLAHSVRDKMKGY
ncbi:MAG TPA: hypothetical protein VJX16_17290 [Terriglobales bacterium]|nr:hypothetical protein [Terriglobales bacterium]